jgi:hypothetical protein
MAIVDTAALRSLPTELSRRQILILDGIRYAAEIADIAYERLERTLQGIAADYMVEIPPPRGIATALLDAWTIVDSAHRYGDLVHRTPGIPNAPWKRLLRDRIAAAGELRNAVQHQLEEVGRLEAEHGQIWGYLSWAECVDGVHTGNWYVASPGTIFRGAKWELVGAPNRMDGLPPGKIRLIAFQHDLALGLVIRAVAEATSEIAALLETRGIRAVGSSAAEDRWAVDWTVRGGSYLVTREMPPEVKYDGEH